MNNIKVLGIGLSKNVFQLHGNDATASDVFEPRTNLD